MRGLTRTWDNRQRSTAKSGYKTWTRRARWYEDASGKDIRLCYEDQEGVVNVYFNDKEVAEKSLKDFKDEVVTVAQLRIIHHIPSPQESKAMRNRCRVNFGGVEVAATDEGDRYRMTRTALIRILEGGKVRCVCTANHDDTCENTGLGRTPIVKVIEHLKDDEPNFLYMTKDGVRTIRYGVHRNLSYDIFEAD